MLISTLKQIGLEEKEAKIYLACLEFGPSSIKEIAIKSGIKRTTIYDIIDDMINSGIIKVTTKGKKKRFIAIEPDDLKVIIKKKEALLNQILPDLNSINNVSATKPKVWFYEGVEGVREAFEDTLDAKKEIFAYAVGEDMFTALSREYFKKYFQRRVKKNIEVRVIAPDTPGSREVSTNDKKEMRTTLLVPANKFNFTVEINMYNNRIMIASWKEKFAVIIESKEIANIQKNIFELAWLGAKQLVKMK